METITSRDGTSIAYQRSGEGPSVVLVHGTAADHGRWRPVLADSRIVVMERGRSRGDGHRHRPLHGGEVLSFLEAD